VAQEIGHFRLKEGRLALLGILDSDGGADGLPAEALLAQCPGEPVEEVISSPVPDLGRDPESSWRRDRRRLSQEIEEPVRWTGQLCLRREMPRIDLPIRVPTGRRDYESTIATKVYARQEAGAIGHDTAEMLSSSCDLEPARLRLVFVHGGGGESLRPGIRKG
jgi:hypothetical protein